MTHGWNSLDNWTLQLAAIVLRVAVTWELHIEYHLVNRGKKLASDDQLTSTSSANFYTSSAAFTETFYGDCMSVSEAWKFHRIIHDPFEIFQSISSDVFYMYYIITCNFVTPLSQAHLFSLKNSSPWEWEPYMIEVNFRQIVHTTQFLITGFNPIKLTLAEKKDAPIDN